MSLSNLFRPQTHTLTVHEKAQVLTMSIEQTAQALERLNEEIDNEAAVTVQQANELLAEHRRLQETRGKNARIISRIRDFLA